MTNPESTFPSQCTCGAEIESIMEHDTKYSWAAYHCGTERVGKHAEPFEDTGKRIERSRMCRHALALRDAGQISVSQAREIWSKDD